MSQDIIWRLRKKVVQYIIIISGIKYYLTQHLLLRVKDPAGVSYNSSCFFIFFKYIKIIFIYLFLKNYF
jgi:hypothetical protein